jgi:hypothetical protein
MQLTEGYESMTAVSVMNGQYMRFGCGLILGGRTLIRSKERLSVQRTSAVHGICSLAKMVMVMLVGGYTVVM